MRNLLLTLLLAMATLSAGTSLAAEKAAESSGPAKTREQKIVGDVISVKPQAKAQRADNTVILQLKDKIRLHDLLKTDAEGRLQILLADETAITVGPSTVISIDEFISTKSNPKAKINLGQGVAKFVTGEIVKMNPDAFVISTPEATIGIRGTALTVKSEGGYTDVFVSNTAHSVTVNEVIVKEGYKIRVASINDHPAPTPINNNDTDDISSLTAGYNLSNSGGELESDPLLPPSLSINEGPQPLSRLGHENTSSDLAGQSLQIPEPPVIETPKPSVPKPDPIDPKPPITIDPPIIVDPPCRRAAGNC